MDGQLYAKTFSNIHGMLAHKTVRCVVRHFDRQVYGKYTVSFTPFTVGQVLDNRCCGSRSSTESVDGAELGPAAPCFPEAWEMRS